MVIAGVDGFETGEAMEALIAAVLMGTVTAQAVNLVGRRGNAEEVRWRPKQFSVSVRKEGGYAIDVNMEGRDGARFVVGRGLKLQPGERQLFALKVDRGN